MRNKLAIIAAFYIFLNTECISQIAKFEATIVEKGIRLYPHVEYNQISITQIQDEINKYIYKDSIDNFRTFIVSASGDSTICFIDRGFLVMKCRYKFGEINGEFWSFWSGDTLSKGFALDGFLNGEYNFSNEYGDTRDIIKGVFKKGEFDGIVEKYEYNKLREKTTVKRGVQEKIIYYSDGSILRRSFYVNDQLMGQEKEFYNGGIKLRRITNYKNGKREGIDIGYYEDGKVRDKINYTSGSGTLTEYNTDGKLEKKTSIKNWERNGPSITYNKDGLIQAVINYKNNKLDGPYILYRNGKPSILFTYKDGVKEGKSESYWDDGKIFIRSMYKEGEKDGIETIYSKNGTISEKKFYRNGVEDPSGISCDCPSDFRQPNANDFSGSYHQYKGKDGHIYYEVDLRMISKNPGWFKSITISSISPSGYKFPGEYFSSNGYSLETTGIIVYKYPFSIKIKGCNGDETFVFKPEYNCCIKQGKAFPKLFFRDLEKK